MTPPRFGFALSLVLACSIANVHADDAPPASQPTPIDYHKLKEQMPDTLAGMKRAKCEGSKMKFGPTSMSTAKADYGEEGKMTAHIEVVDYANPEMAKGLAAWSQLEMDNETDDGFQKTAKIQDQPAMLEYNNKEKTGTITVMAGGLMVKAELHGVTADDFKTVQDALPIKALAALHN